MASSSTRSYRELKYENWNAEGLGFSYNFLIFSKDFTPDLVITDKLPCFSVLCQMIKWTNGKTENESRDSLLTSMLMRNKN